MKINIYIYSVLVVCFFSFSCSQSFLDKQPLDALSNQTYWKNEDEALMAVNACYRYFGDDWWKTFYTCATDDSYAWSNWPCDILYAGNGSATTSLGTFSHFWSFFYQAIAAANNVIDNVGNVQNISEDLKKRIAAEARFIRAYSYQQLVGLYGDVPLITTLQTTDEFLVTRTPKNEVIQFLVNDINEFAEDLPESYNSLSDYGRVTKGAAYALQARILLYDEQWAEAAVAADKVIDIGIYGIDDDYESLFNGTNENSSEIILSAQYIPADYTSAIATWIGGPAVGGWSEVVPVQSLVDAYECTDGLTIDESTVYDPDFPFENRDPRLLMTIVVPGSELNGITIDITDSNSPDGLGKNNASYSGYYYKKYIPAEIDGWWGGNSANDIIILRYAEVLLTYAEAKIEANQIDQSVYDAINEVRGRASVNLPLITSGTQSELREIVRRERRVEFALEEQRLFDIRRWKIADQVMSGSVYGILNYWDTERSDYGSHVLIETRQFNSTRDYLWPVPQGERDLNSNLEQNPGW